MPASGTPGAPPAAPATVALADVRDAPIDAAEVVAAVTAPDAGAIATFAGLVRDHDHGREVLRLDYEGHPTAAAVLAEVAADVAERHPGTRVAVLHRIGALAIGDAALVAAVAAPHRAEAFAACSALVDETKARLPVWKHQFFGDGTDEWVNCA